MNSLFYNLTGADRITLEGREVREVRPIIDPKAKDITHYGLVVAGENARVDLRKFRISEIDHLIEREALIIDRGYYSLARQTDRALYSDNSFGLSSKKQRSRVERLTFLAARMEHYHCQCQMKLTREGVEAFRPRLSVDYMTYQAQTVYGTEKSNSTQSLKPLPANATLLAIFRKWRRSGGDARAFLSAKGGAVDTEALCDDLNVVLPVLYDYASATKPSKSEIGEKAVAAVRAENKRRTEMGYSRLLTVRSAATYVRWIDKHLDPFTVMSMRDGLAAARKRFGTVEQQERDLVPGECIQFDAWKVHAVSLDTTRAAFLRMTQDERAKLDLVRRWVVVAIDCATRMVLGFAFCRSPNQAASLQALRMCFADKTYLLREAGLKHGSWNQRATSPTVATDSGSEFGKHPFGGAQFGAAVRHLAGSLINPPAGVPELRGVIERFFRTMELRNARFVPGWTASHPRALNDRKPTAEASMVDDDLHRLFVQSIAEYHSTSHRGINGMTPIGKWQELTKKPIFDATAIPGPTALREACGEVHEGTLSENGIRFMGAWYSSEFTRSQRLAPGSERVDKNMKQIEFVVDRFDLGAISIKTDNSFVTVPCLDPEMIGKSMEQRVRELAFTRQAARISADEASEAREEARNLFRADAEAIARSAGVDIHGRSLASIRRAALELSFGKGHHEKPFIGQDEQIDPFAMGFALAGEVDSAGWDEVTKSRRTPEACDVSEDKADEPNAMDRFRTAVKPRLNSSGRGGDV